MSPKAAVPRRPARATLSIARGHAEVVERFTDFFEEV
jgi:hypothetical protein